MADREPYTALNGSKADLGSGLRTYEMGKSD